MFCDSTSACPIWRSQVPSKRLTAPPPNARPRRARRGELVIRDEARPCPKCESQATDHIFIKARETHQRLAPPNTDPQKVAARRSGNGSYLTIRRPSNVSLMDNARRQRAAV